MARVKGQDNLGDILRLIKITSARTRKKKPNNTTPSSERIIEDMKTIVTYMAERKPKQVTRQEIEKLLRLEFSNHSRNSKEYRRISQAFYARMTPLLRTVIVSDREQLQYQLSSIKFTTWFKSIERTGKEMFGQ